MNNRIALFAVWLAAVVAFATPAMADARDDYVTLKAAELLNLQCGVLKFVEHSVLARATVDKLDITPQSTDLVLGKITREAFSEWKQTADAEAAAKASAAGCTAAAEPYLLAARATVSQEIYQGLFLAFYLNSLPADDIAHFALDADQRLAAERYDGFLQQVYGASFPAFSEAQKQAAMARLPASASVGGWEALGQLYDDDLSRSNDDVMQFWAVGSDAGLVLRQVELEVIAESNGWLVRPLQVNGGAAMPVLMRADGTAPGIRVPVWSGPLEYRTDAGGEFRLALARLPNGAIRVMTYGEGAASLASGATVRLYVPATSLPDGMSGYAFFEHPDFRQASAVFEGNASSGPCLGGACYEFPQEATAAIFDLGAEGYAELFIAPGVGTEPGSIAPGVERSGRVSAAELMRAPG